MVNGLRSIYKDIDTSLLVPYLYNYDILFYIFTLFSASFANLFIDQAFSQLIYL